MRLLPIIYLTLALLSCLKSINCKCKTSFLTTCESLNDVAKYGTEHWSKLVIQDDLCSSIISPPQDILKPRTFNNVVNLEHLYIVKKLNEIRPNAFAILSNLHFLQLYKNELKVLYKNTFTGFKNLHKLEVTDNGIENIVHGLFQDTAVQEIDFSNNKLSNIQVGQLNIPSLKKLTFRNNKISQIVVGCFHENLEYLNLEHNHLDTVDVMVFGLVTNLKTLILSNNKFQSVVKIPRMDSLEYLDLSHNMIYDIASDAFEELRELKFLSLSNNKVTALTNNIFGLNSGIKVLHLHMNYLTNLLVDSARKFSTVEEITLGGNPWICKCLLLIKNFLKANNISFASCDSQFFDKGLSPVCVIEDQTNCKTQRISPSFLNEEYALEFRKMTKYDC